MSAVPWLPVGTTDPHKLRQASHQVHNAAQWLARAAHSFMTPQPEQAHTWLRWDAQSRALVTKEFLPKLTLELKPADLMLQFRENGTAAPHIIELDDRTPAEVEAWMLVELLHRRLDRDQFSKALPYEMLDLMTGDAVPYLRETLETPLSEVAAWLTNAASVLARIAEECVPGASVWCRPDVFHMVLVQPAGAGASASGAKLCAGLALGDAKLGEPYFYIALDGPGIRVEDRPPQMLSAAALSSSARPASQVLEFFRTELGAHRETSER